MGVKVQRGALRALTVGATLALASNAWAQSPAQVTAADYDRAVKMLSQYTNPLVDHAATGVTWLDDKTFAWFDNDGSNRCDRYTMVFYPPVEPFEVESTMRAITRP